MAGDGLGLFGCGWSLVGLDAGGCAAGPVGEEGDEPAEGVDADAQVADGCGICSDVALLVLVGGGDFHEEADEVVHEFFDAVFASACVAGGDGRIGLKPVSEGVGVGHSGILGDGGEEFALGDAVADAEGEGAFFLGREVVSDVAHMGVLRDEVRCLW